MKTLLFLTVAFLFVTTTSGQDTIISADYFLPENFSKSLKWNNAINTNAINEQFYCKKDSQYIKNCNEAFNIIDTEKDFCLLYSTCKWCKNNYVVAFPKLLQRLTDTTKIGLEPYTDLYITDRPEYYIRNPMSTGSRPGILINEDIFTIAGRASWILNEITGENFAIVHPSASIKELEQFKQNWIDWIKKLK